LSLLLGYNTNGFAHHGLADALEIIAETGYRSVAITPDVHHWVDADDWTRMGEHLTQIGLTPVIETGARFLLDPRRKHHPTLLSRTKEERRSRLTHLALKTKHAAAIGAPCVSLWSGRDEGEDNWALLDDQLSTLCVLADSRGLDLAFEPEPGMFVDTMEKFDELCTRVDHPRLKLTLDVGHVRCLEAEPPEDVIRRYADRLVNVHLDDHRKGVHEHLFFGEGEIDFAPVMQALHEVARNRDLPATVELSRHSHDAVETARRAFEFLNPR
jgi:sugar phosphate isomerase/epimerase